MIRVPLSCILLIWFAAGCAATAPRAATPPRVVQFRSVAGLMYIDAAVNGSGPYGMIVDTGANSTILSPTASAAATVKRGRSESAHGFGPNSQTTTRLHNVTLSLPGDMTLKSPFVSEAPEATFSYLNSSSGEKFDGILGYDLFRRFVVEIDPDAKVIRLHEPNTFRYRGEGAKLKLRVRDRKSSVRVKIVGKPGDKPIECWLDLDTGAGPHLVLCKPFLDRHPLDQGSNARPYLGRGFGGQAMDSYGRIAQFILGPYDFGGLYAIYSRSSEKVGDGVIGQGVLNRFKMFIDYSRSDLILEPRQSVDAAVPRDRSGLYIAAEGPTLREFRIDHIYADTPATRAGVKIGDRIVEIDDQPASAMKLSEIRDRLTQREDCAITIQRNDETIRIVLELKPKSL